MTILVIGTGYVGLVTGACFAEMGQKVICLDIDHNKIDLLNRGGVPIYEPELEPMIHRAVKSDRLKFTTDYASSVKACTICMIAVTTPSSSTGECDLSYVKSAATEVARHMDGYLVIVIKSTVPPGTAAMVEKEIRATLQTRGVDFPFDVVSNPEFLKEGCACSDCMKPDRIILGSNSEKAIAILQTIYAPFNLSSNRVLIMSRESAEMTKYAANSMLATRISFMNEMAQICEHVGADIHEVRQGIGSDSRIGPYFLYAGPGFGGSCFPKDLRALIAIKNQVDENAPSVIKSVFDLNEKQKLHTGNMVIDHFNSRDGIQGKEIAIWGLSFKPDTDDMREAPSLTLIHQLQAAGAKLRLFDPLAMERAKQILQNPDFVWASSEYEAAKGADAIVVITEWKQFRFPDYSRLKQEMRCLTIFDARNQYKKTELKNWGFNYFGIGVKPALEAILV